MVKINIYSIVKPSKDQFDDLIKEFDNIPNQAKQCIKRDLVRNFEDDDRDRAKNREVKTLGHDMDRAKWLEVLGVFSGL